MGGHRVYIGHLSRNAEKRDLEDLFKSYGRILDITVKNGFGFVEFDDKADAEDAVHDFHGTKFMGQRQVQWDFYLLSGVY
jgi:arginine/serine-rich splicing factor 4/5/6